MSENMIERVARAIMESRGGCDVVDWREAGWNQHVAEAIKEARAAIQAMREPTDETCRAIDIALHELEPKWGPIVRTSIALCVKEAWFDAALNHADTEGGSK